MNILRKLNQMYIQEISHLNNMSIFKVSPENRTNL